MRQNENCCEHPHEEKVEPVYSCEIMVNGVTVYESFRVGGSELWECLLQSMGKM